MKPSSFRSLCLLLASVMPQIVSAQIHFTSTLYGVQEVPPVVSPATGTGSFELSEDRTELRYFVSYQGMNASDAGLHAGAAGVNGALARSLAAPTPPSGTFSGVWTSGDASPLTPAFVDSLLSGRLYLELKAPGGSSGIRGQLELSTSLHFQAVIDGAHENPPVSTSAGGTGVFVLDETRTRLDYWVTYRGLTGALSSGGELRTGEAGANGPVVHMIASPGDAASATIAGSWKATDNQPLTGALVDSLIAGRMYANFTTAGHQGGEICGQLVLSAGIGFVALLDSAQENPPTRARASGTGSFVLHEGRDGVTYVLTYIGLTGGISGGGHVHLGRAGSTGLVVKTLAPGSSVPEGTISGTWNRAGLTESFTPALAESLIAGKLYSDLHTASNGGGEIRGQINLTTGVGFTSQLSAKENVPPIVHSNGTGTASVILSPDRQSIMYNLTYLDLVEGISGSGGHFHTGVRGINGGLVKLIVPPNAPTALTIAGKWSSSEAGSQPLTPAIVDSLIAGHMYINLHTDAYMGGEIRGQLSYDFDALTSLHGISPLAPPQFRLEQNFPNPFNPSTTIRFTVPHRSRVQLTVFNALGQKIADLIQGDIDAGVHEVKFNAGNLASGAFFYRLQAGDFVQTRALVVLK